MRFSFVLKFVFSFVLIFVVRQIPASQNLFHFLKGSQPVIHIAADCRGVSVSAVWGPHVFVFAFFHTAIQSVAVSSNGLSKQIEFASGSERAFNLHRRNGLGS